MNLLKFFGSIAAVIVMLIGLIAGCQLSVSYWQGSVMIFVSINLAFLFLWNLMGEVCNPTTTNFIAHHFSPMWVRRLFIPMNTIGVPCGAMCVYQRILHHSWIGVIDLGFTFFLLYMLLADLHICWLHYRGFMSVNLPNDNAQS